MSVYNFLFILFFIGGSPFLLAQQPPTTPNDTAKVDSSRLTIQQGTPVDTVPVLFFRLNEVGKMYGYADTSLGRAQQYDLARRQSVEWLHLGNPATAARPLLFQTVDRKGFDNGLHGFDLYRLTADSVRFYSLNTPFSEVSYIANRQTDGMVTARFARNFGNTQLTLDYHRISNLNTEQRSANSVAIQNPRARAVAFALGLWYKSTNQRYNGYFSYTSNFNSQLETGGIQSDTVFTQKADATLSSASNFLTGAETRYENLEFQYLQTLQLNRTKDTIKELSNKRAYLLSHRINFNRNKYRFGDKIEGADTILAKKYYPTFYQTDMRGLRMAYVTNVLENEVNISTQKTTNSLLELGILQQTQQASMEGLGSNVWSNLLLKGRFNQSFSKFVQLNTYAHFVTLGENLGDYRLKGDLTIDFPRLGSLTASLQSQLYEPTNLQQQLAVSGVQVWNNQGFQKTLDNQLSATLSIPRLRHSSTFRVINLNNFIIFNDSTKPEQITTPLSVVQLRVQQNFKFRALHLDNTLVFQKSSNETAIKIPTLYSLHSLYYEGLDFRQNTAYEANGYMPLSGQFFAQNSRVIAPYPALDIFVAAKIQTFRIFLKMENVGRTSGISDAVGFPTLGYPNAEQQFRFGIRWVLRD